MINENRSVTSQRRSVNCLKMCSIQFNIVSQGLGSERMSFNLNEPQVILEIFCSSRSSLPRQSCKRLREAGEMYFL